MELQGRDFRERPSFSGAATRALLGRAKCNLLRFSESFADAKALLAESRAAAAAPRDDSLYRSSFGSCSQPPPEGASLALVALQGRTNARGTCKI
jgi:hypothetical protein